MKNLTVSEKIAELKAKQELEFKSQTMVFEIEEKLLKSTGLDFMVVCYNKEKCNDFGAFIENGRYNGNKFDRTKINSYLNSIVKEMDLKPVNDSFGFAGKDNIDLATNCRVSIDNNISDLCFYHPTIAKIGFKFDGLSIEFKEPVQTAFSGNHLGTETKIHPDDTHKNKDQRRKTYFYLKGFDMQRYYGGISVTSTTDNDKVSEFLDVVFNGY